MLGMKYHDFDVMCDSNSKAYVLTTDLRTGNGIFLPKGTIIPLQKCEYADRFSVKFYLTHIPDHIDAFVPFEPKTKKDQLALSRGTIFQYGLGTKKSGH